MSIMALMAEMSVASMMAFITDENDLDDDCGVVGVNHDLEDFDARGVLDVLDN